MKKFKIKTSCGIEKYNKLKTNKTFIGKLRLYWFKFFAKIRNLNKKCQKCKGEKLFFLMVMTIFSKNI